MDGHLQGISIVPSLPFLEGEILVTDALLRLAAASKKAWRQWTSTAEVLHLGHTHPTPTDDDQICDSRPHEDHFRVVAVAVTLQVLLVQPALAEWIVLIEPTPIPMDLPWVHQVEAQLCLLQRGRPCIPVNHPIKNPIINPVL